MRIINVIRVVLQTADLGGFVGTLTDFYKSEVRYALSEIYLNDPAIGQLEIGDDESICGSVLVQLPKIGNLPDFAIYRILIMQALGGFESFSEDGYLASSHKDKEHSFFLKKKVNLSKGNYEIQKDYVTFIEKQKSGKAGIFHLGIEFEG